MQRLPCFVKVDVELYTHHLYIMCYVSVDTRAECYMNEIHMKRPKLPFEMSIMYPEQSFE